MFAVLPLPNVDYGSRRDREWWWGGIVSLGTVQPHGSVGARMSWELDLHHTMYNQNNPVLVSNMGRYLWIDKPRKVRHRAGRRDKSHETVGTGGARWG